MRYAQIRSLDVSNGAGVGMSLFVQGCPFHCHNCFNPETWDFSGGNEYTEDTYLKLEQLLDRPYIKRFSILGGEPLAEQNAETVGDIISYVRLWYGHEKKIWLYTGYTIEQIVEDYKKYYIRDLGSELERTVAWNRYFAIVNCDVLVDGRYVDDLKGRNLEFRGSSNQRLIDIKKTIEKGEIILWEP